MHACGLAFAIALYAGATSTPATADTVRTGAWVEHQLRAGQRIALARITVTGPVDLNNIDTVRRTFECHQCNFTGPISAHDVIFQRTFDLSGSTFKAAVDFTGARFQGPALFRAALPAEESPSARLPCRFRKSAVFSLAVFDDLVSFSHTRFCGRADFRDTRFSDSTFSSARFANAEFMRAAFRGITLFNDAQFQDHASFEEADFRLRADFARAGFLDGGDFAVSRFGGGASFLAADFNVNKNDHRVDEAATFQNAVSTGDLNFTFATFESQLANFADLVSSGSLVFSDATFDKNSGFTLDRLQVQNLALDVGAVNGIYDASERIGVLKKIEESAKERGDIATANNAHYQMRVLASQHYNDLWRGLDLIFYRGIAGYLVRPLRPLLVLAGLAALVAFIRMRSRRTPQTVVEGETSVVRKSNRRTQPAVVDAERPALGRRLWRGASSRCATFLGCLLDTLAIAGPRWRSGDKTLALPERLEVVAYRLLLVCVVIGLANSNPTLRQMLDSLL